MQIDGAIMADLVMTCDTSDETTQICWVHRLETANQFKEGCYPSRNNWMLGFVINSGRNFKDVEVSFNRDIDTTWVSHFTEGELVFSIQCPIVETELQKVTFDEWVKLNFKQIDIIETKEGKSVIVRILFETVPQTFELLKWAKTNFRKVQWTTIHEHISLFDKSPREVQDNLDVARETFKLSTNHTVSDKSEMLDYFISHTWEDKPGQKRFDELKKYLTSTSKNNSIDVSLWLDKVCINQLDPSFSLAVLPININLCDKVLVLLSQKYVDRLWCVWELFSLFAFCNREVATSRVKIIMIDNGNASDILLSLKDFDINRCHCYDPNEEMKLRKIMTMVGLDRLKTSLKEVSESLKMSSH